MGSADNLLAIEYYNRGVDLAYEGKYDEALVPIDRALEENAHFILPLVTKAGILNSWPEHPWQGTGSGGGSDSIMVEKEDAVSINQQSHDFLYKIP